MKYTMTAQMRASPPHDAIDMEINITLAVMGNFWMIGTKIPDMDEIGKWINLWMD